MVPPLRLRSVDGRLLEGAPPPLPSAQDVSHPASQPSSRPESPPTHELLDVPRIFARPLAEADLAPVPPAWRVGPPDFVGLGQGKAGTTWWWSLLEQHPQVVANRAREKELHHFSHFDLRGPDAAANAVYARAFARPDGAVCGDFTCTYLSHPLALEYVHAAAPDARCLVMLRDPLERAVSALEMWHRRRKYFYANEDAPERLHLVEAISLFPEALQSSLVSDRLARAFELYGRENVLVLQFERAKRDPLAEFRRTLAHLGIDPSFAPKDARRPVNTAGDTRLFKRPTGAVRERLVEFFRRDVERTLDLVGDFEPELWSGANERVAG